MLPAGMSQVWSRYDTRVDGVKFEIAEVVLTV